MKNANELKSIAHNANAAHTVALMTRANELLTRRIMPTMEAEARKGSTNAFIRMNYSSLYPFICTTLISMGYRVSYRNCILSVYWND